MSKYFGGIIMEYVFLAYMIVGLILMCIRTDDEKYIKGENDRQKKRCNVIYVDFENKRKTNKKII